MRRDHGNALGDREAGGAGVDDKGRDALGARRLAHRLKGSSRSVGLQEVAERAEAIEMAVRTGALSEAQQQLQALREALQRGLGALRAIA